MWILIEAVKKYTRTRKFISDAKSLFNFFRLEQLHAQQNQEKEQKLKKWEIWVIRMTELEKKCQEKLDDLKSKGEPEDTKDVEDLIILAKVSSL